MSQDEIQEIVFGDLYTRDNEALNQDLIHFIEAHGGQVITTPYTSFPKMIVRPYYWKWFLEGKYLNLLSTRAFMAALGQLEKSFTSGKAPTHPRPGSALMGGSDP